MDCNNYSYVGNDFGVDYPTVDPVYDSFEIERRDYPNCGRTVYIVRFPDESWSRFDSFKAALNFAMSQFRTA